MSFISKKQVLVAEETLLAAIKNNNVVKLEALLHDDLLFHLPNGEILTKAVDLEAHRSGNMIVNTIIPSDHVINIIDDTAVVSLCIEASGKIFEQPMEGKFRYIRVWKLINGNLKVIGGSCIQLI